MPLLGAHHSAKTGITASPQTAPVTQFSGGPAAGANRSAIDPSLAFSASVFRPWLPVKAQMSMRDGDGWVMSGNLSKTEGKQKQQ